MERETRGGISIEKALSTIAHNTLGLSESVVFKEVGELKEHKMNYADRRYTTYVFQFYIADFDGSINKKKIENRKFVWHSMDNILKNRNTKNKNMNVADYVNKNTALSDQYSQSVCEYD